MAIKPSKILAVEFQIWGATNEESIGAHAQPSLGSNEAPNSLLTRLQETVLRRRQLWFNAFLCSNGRPGHFAFAWVGGRKSHGFAARQISNHGFPSWDSKSIWKVIAKPFRTLLIHFMQIIDKPNRIQMIHQNLYQTGPRHHDLRRLGRSMLAVVGLKGRVESRRTLIIQRIPGNKIQHLGAYDLASCIAQLSVTQRTAIDPDTIFRRHGCR